MLKTPFANNMKTLIFFIVEIAKRAQKAYIKCLTEYENSYCQLDDVLVVDQCNFLGIDVIPYFSTSRIFLTTFAATIIIVVLLTFVIVSPYQNRAFQVYEDQI